jgi:5-methylcytosine-specific restriction endonuclease McrA
MVQVKPSHMERTGHEAERNQHGQCVICSRAAAKARRLDRNKALNPEFFSEPSTVPMWSSRQERMRFTHNRRRGHDPVWNKNHSCITCQHEWAKDWRQRNPEKAKASRKATDKARYRRLRMARGAHTAKDIQAQMVAQRGQCFWCACLMGADYHVDHLIPLSRGGSNNPDNIVLACPTCNLKRGKKLPSEFRAVP